MKAGLNLPVTVAAPVLPLRSSSAEATATVRDMAHHVITIRPVVLAAIPS
ncbi:hypothetical protein [Pseudarthrobacter sp. MM222]|nr:hypothetical protein [Pseudarthrobacter sp. MM222]